MVTLGELSGLRQSPTSRQARRSARRPWCDGKHRHKSEGAALAHVRALRRSLGVEDGDTLVVHKCVTCLQWHCGHRLPAS